MEERKEAVLIVDDQPNWRKLLNELLEDEYKVVSVGSYDEALKALPAQDPPFHVAAIDIRLIDEEPTNEQGLELAAALNKMGEYTNIIVVTGYPTLRTVRKSLRDLAAFEYVEKYPADGKAFDHVWFRKIVRRAVDDAEKRRPRPFVRKGSRVLVVEGDDGWRERLVAILREDEYEVDSLATTQDLVGELKAHAYNLLILNAAFLAQDRGLLPEIREYEPDAKIIMVTDAEIGELIRDIRDKGILNVFAIKDDCFDRQQFRLTVRRAFSFEATKYILVRFEGPDDEPLKVGQHYVLSLVLQDIPGKDTLAIWLPPQETKRGSTLMVAVYAPDMKVQPGEEIPWQIPAEGFPPPLKMELLPKVAGRKMILLDIEANGVWLGRLEKEVKVIEVVA